MQDKKALLILVSGMPATGKTTFAAWLGERLGIPMASKDLIKEILFDTLGFKSREGKVALSDAAVCLLYDFARSHLRIGQPVILENNYAAADQPGLLALIEEYNCKTLSVHFTADYQTLFHRFLERDRSPGRHRGHVVNSEYPETGGPALSLESRGVTVAGFEKAMAEKGIAAFSIGGDRIVVDTTDFSKVDYQAVLAGVEGYMNG
jgi:predicted kinase